MKDTEVEAGLDAGVLMTRLDDTTYDIIKGVNTDQTNTFMVNSDGSTHLKSIRRIARQINKELQYNMRNTLLKNPAGTNRNTLTSTGVAAFVSAYLKDITASSTEDDLILSYQNVTVSVMVMLTLWNMSLLLTSLLASSSLQVS